MLNTDRSLKVTLGLIAVALWGLFLRPLFPLPPAYAAPTVRPPQYKTVILGCGKEDGNLNDKLYQYSTDGWQLKQVIPYTVEEVHEDWGIYHTTTRVMAVLQK